MTENEYVCLDCGRQFIFKLMASDRAEPKCPNCGSGRMMKLSPSNWFGLFGGGGG